MDASKNDIRVIIANDQPAMLEGIAILLKDIEKIRVVAMVRNSAEVVSKVKQLSPEILLLDTTMPDLDIISCIKEINALSQKTKIICLGNADTKNEIILLTYAGVDGYLSKGTITQDLSHAVKKVMNGGKYFSEEVSDMIINIAVSKHTKTPETQNKFSDIELEIIQLVCADKTMKDIGVYLDINVRTLEAAKIRIMKKMGVKNVMGLVSHAIKNRIIDLNTLPD